MQRFKPLETIVEALRGSKELLEVSEDGTSVRRKVPLVKPSEEVHKELSNRTVYAVTSPPTSPVPLQPSRRLIEYRKDLEMRRQACKSI